MSIGTLCPTGRNRNLCSSTIPFRDAGGWENVTMPRAISVPRQPPGAAGLMRRLNPNRIFLPRALRDAIPDLPTCVGRDLQLDSISGRVTDVLFLGRCIQL